MKGICTEGGDVGPATSEEDEGEGSSRREVGQSGEEVAGACNEACMIAICCMGVTTHLQRIFFKLFKHSSCQ